jgi:hypothetical protein
LPKNLSTLSLRAACGFVIGLAMWGGLSVPYTRAIGFLTETTLRIFERPAKTLLIADGTMLIVDRSDAPSSPSAMRFAVATTDITFNLIVLVTLFAAASHPFADRNVAGFVTAAVALVFVHVAAVISFVEAYYATSLGTWSAAHYSDVARRIWVAAPYFYSMVGVYGAPIALWWLYRPSAQADQATPARVRIAARRRVKGS